MRSVTIKLLDGVAHRLEVRAAIDDLTLAEGIEKFLCHTVRRFNVQRRWDVRRQLRAEGVKKHGNGHGTSKSRAY